MAEKSSLPKLLLMGSTLACAPLSEPLGIALGFDLVRLLTESMSQFVADGKIEKLIKRNMPLFEQFDLPLWLGHNQDLFDKRLTHFQVAKRWAVGIQMKLGKNPLPILGANQYPGPVAQLLSGVTVKDWS
jgi:hypothetical protein